MNKDTVHGASLERWQAAPQPLARIALELSPHDPHFQRDVLGLLEATLAIAGAFGLSLVSVDTRARLKLLDRPFNKPALGDRHRLLLDLDKRESMATGWNLRQPSPGVRPILRKLSGDSKKPETVSELIGCLVTARNEISHAGRGEVPDDRLNVMLEAVELLVTMNLHFPRRVVRIDGFATLDDGTSGPIGTCFSGAAPARFRRGTAFAVDLSDLRAGDLLLEPSDGEEWRRLDPIFAVRSNTLTFAHGWDASRVWMWGHQEPEQTSEPWLAVMRGSRERPLAAFVRKVDARRTEKPKVVFHDVPADTSVDKRVEAEATARQSRDARKPPQPSASSLLALYGPGSLEDVPVLESVEVELRRKSAGATQSEPGEPLESEPASTRRTRAGNDITSTGRFAVLMGALSLAIAGMAMWGALHLRDSTAEPAPVSRETRPDGEPPPPSDPTTSSVVPEPTNACGSPHAKARVLAAIDDWSRWSCRERGETPLSLWSSCLRHFYYVGDVGEACPGELRCCPPDPASAARQTEALSDILPYVCGKSEADRASDIEGWSSFRCQEPSTLPPPIRDRCLSRAAYSSAVGTGCVEGMLCCPGELR